MMLEGDADMEFRCAHSGRQLEPGLEVAVERLECRHCDSHHQFLLPRTCRATYSLLLTRSTPTWYERVLWLLLTATLCKSTKRLCFVHSFLSSDVFLRTLDKTPILSGRREVS